MNKEHFESVAEAMFESAWNFWSLANNTQHDNIELIKDLNNPKIGDYVFETTNPFVPKLIAVGKLLEHPRRGEYVIQRIDGEIHNWTHAKMNKVPDERTKKLIK